MSVGSFTRRYLDPASRLAEVLFGLIMTLTFTLGAGIMLQEEGREGARQLLVAFIGSNVAWGIIDGALYMVGQLFERGRLRQLRQKLRHASDDEARGIVADELDEVIAPVTTDAERAALYRRIVANVRAEPVGPPALTRKDVFGAAVTFWLVFVVSLPAALPFVLMHDAWLALRVSNAILLALLFGTGVAWARYTLARPWLVGVCFLLGGTALVVIAITLGG